MEAKFAGGVSFRYVETNGPLARRDRHTDQGVRENAIAMRYAVE